MAMADYQKGSWVEAVEQLKRGKCSCVWDEKACSGKIRFIHLVDKNRYRIGCDTCGSTPQGIGPHGGASRQNALRLMLQFEFERVSGDCPIDAAAQKFHKERYEKIVADANAKKTQSQGIPTTYNSIDFRSRLETKWAVFFDILGWTYQYEPYEFEGYIPDFALTFRKPLLVEVKPVSSTEEVYEKCQKAISAAWDNDTDILIVGSHIGLQSDETTELQQGHRFNIGWIATGPTKAKQGFRRVTGAPFMVCPFCEQLSIYAYSDQWPSKCVLCGQVGKYRAYAPMFHRGMHNVKLLNMWTRAGNHVQYNKPRFAGA